MSETVHPTYRKLASAYSTAAYTTFNVLLFVFLINVLLGAVFLVRDLAKAPAPVAVDHRVSEYRQRFADLEAYTRIAKETANAFLDEQDEISSIGFRYEPWVQFRHPAFAGKLLNTNGEGFRATVAPDRSVGEPLRVFVFGGSTTFGVGVPDSHTIPSYLQRVLESSYPTRAVVVSNFGQSFYYSSQELIVLLRLLKDGYRPDVAVFIDGGNDTAQLALRHDLPNFTPRVGQLWAAALKPQTGQGPPLEWASWVPMVRLAMGLQSRFTGIAVARPTETPGYVLIKDDRHFTDQDRKEVIDYVVQRYLANVRVVRAVAQDFGFQCLFVWQPHPGYKYNKALHRTFPFPGPVPGYFTGVFDAMRRYQAADFLYLGDMLEHASSKVYVDDVHYNEATNELIAQGIADRLRASSLAGLAELRTNALPQRAAQEAPPTRAH